MILWVVSCKSNVGEDHPTFWKKKAGLTKVTVSTKNNPLTTRWAPTGYTWGWFCGPYKWPYKWVTGVIPYTYRSYRPISNWRRGPPCTLVLLVYTKVSMGFCGWASIPTQLFTGPSLKDGDSTGTKDWCRHHSCIHYIFVKSHDILYIDI